jgi:malonyl-CoA/methylmalonyl-CoA synthetase
MSSLLDRLLGEGRDDDLALLPDVSYGALRAAAARLSGRLRQGRPSLDGAAVAFLAPPAPDYVVALLGIMHAGGTAVPLSPLHTAPELAHLFSVAQPTAVLADGALAERLRPLGAAAPAVTPISADGTPALPADVADEGPALMLFTSGTTGKPKGVVLSHRSVAATCASLHEAWGWRRDDRLLHLLPLHHTHGVIVALLGALWAGAGVRLIPFDARAAWEALASTTVLMAVPTIYVRLMEALRAAPGQDAARWRASAAALRLFTSGSAALPAALLEEFRAATGQTILERYGMTEIGMALSNPLAGRRIPGAVGTPLPGVQVDIVGDDGALCAAGEPGELRIRSPQLFSGYHGDTEGTARAYDAEGRFRTGDTGVRDPAGVIRLLGRTSTDVLKSGGYKLSALEIEDALREHPAVAEVAVIGTPDPVWGDRVTACVVLRAGASLALEDLQSFARSHLAPYKLPRALVLLPELPRNALGKVGKTRLKELVIAGAR